MADEAARPPRSGAELQAHMRQLRSLVDNGLLRESDVEEEMATLKSEAKAWQQRTAGAGMQLAPGETAALPLPPPPPPPPPAVGLRRRTRPRSLLRTRPRSLLRRRLGCARRRALGRWPPPGVMYDPAHTTSQPPPGACSLS